MYTILGLVSIYFLFLAEAQNASSANDIINSMKTSFEAAGGGALKLGPMGLFGDMSGQFGMKVNKEQTSSAAAVVHSKTFHGKLLESLGPKLEKTPKSLVQGSKNSLTKKDMKSCGGRGYYGRPVIIPIIVSTTAATTTTTAAAARK